ncbi:MAG: hypothetical protein ABIR82_06220 [Nocardioides sp.]
MSAVLVEGICSTGLGEDVPVELAASGRAKPAERHGRAASTEVHAEGMEAKPSSVPDFYIPRPGFWSAVEAGEFELLYAAQVQRSRAGHRIDYRLDIPKWKFLCWLAETKDLLLHGSNLATLRTLEPRRPRDTSEFGGQEAVFGSSDAVWAMFYAVADRRVATSLVNGCFSTRRDGEDSFFYYFSVNDDALAKGAWRSGTMYVLPRDTFQREAPAEGADPSSEHQWASLEPVSPVAALDVKPEDFPLFAEVRGHDVDEVIARSTRDPDAFPWLDHDPA